MKEIIKKYYEKCLPVNRANSDDTAKFLKIQFMKTGSKIALACPISIKEISFEIKDLSTKKTVGPDGLITLSNM